MSLERAYIAGVLHGDGWCTRLSLGLRVSDPDFAAAFSESLLRETGVSAPVRIDERGYCLARVRNGSGRFDGLKDYEPVGDDESGMWLRGLFDSEGNAQCTRVRNRPNSVHRRIAIYSTNRDTLIRAERYLARLCIPTALRPTKNSDSHKGKLEVWELRVCRRDGFVRFTSLVGSNIKRKLLVMNEIVANYRDPREAAREAQRRGAASKAKRREEETLPRVIADVRAIIVAEGKATQRRCLELPGYAAVLGVLRHSEIVRMAEQRP